MSEISGPAPDGRGAQSGVDRAIDGAVREMLGVEPPADLRARVMDRLPAAGSRLPASGAWRVAFAAAMALILIAAFVARRHAPAAPAAPLVAANAPDTRLPFEPGPAIEPRPEIAPAAPGHVAAATPRAGAAASIDGGAATIAIEPLKRLPPIGVAPIDQNRIAPAEIAVPGLNAIGDMQIAPLTPPDRR